MEIGVHGIEELETFAQEIEQAARVVSSLQGEIATVYLDPHDPSSVDAAIRRVADVIDGAVALYRHNATLVEMTEALKEEYADSIRQQAADALVDGDAEHG